MSSIDLARKIAATSTLSSWKKIPHVSFIFDIDITNMYKRYLVDRASIEHSTSKISFNTLIVKLIAESIEPFPKLYSSFSYNLLTHNLKYKYADTVDINIPWVLTNGEMVPFIFKDVARKGLEEFSNEIEELKNKVKSIDTDNEMIRAAIFDTRKKIRSLKVSALTRILPLKIAKIMSGYRNDYKNDDIMIDPNGIIVSNVGSILGDIKGKFGLLEIIEPKIIAIGISSIEDKICVNENGNGFHEKHILPLTVAFDHRAIDFGDIVPFIKTLNERANAYNAET
jgi:pyruvate dehydrogenase E2 component (dihydrolipoamide acetyltransferase)